MATKNYIAFDLGASNGRGIVGRFDGNKLTMEEIHRFPNEFVNCNGIDYWDSLNLFAHIKTCLSKYAIEHGDPLSAMGIDTWGVDYGLLDKNGQLLGNTICYRNSEDATMEEAWKSVTRRELFDRTGIAHLNFNTLYQLYARKLRNDVALEHADAMLFMPDLLAYFLTGEKGSEYTIASTAMMLNAQTGGWDKDILRRLGLPTDIYARVQPSGTKRGLLREAICTELGCGRIPFVAVGEHDTASAVAAVPGQGDFAFLSSGTWSLFGVETGRPVLTDAVYEAGYSNEGTVQGGFRPLKNIMGLWLIQQCKRLWEKRGEFFSYDEIVVQARAATPFAFIIDPDYGEFFSSTNMEESIQSYCQRTGQGVPQSKGEIARCIYESLALKYRWALERLQEIKGARLNALHIVGGGIQNKLLNQFAADATGRTVITGPIEGACIGNLLVQAIAMGDILDITQLREVVSRSFEVEEYEPQPSAGWDDAFGMLLKLMEHPEI